MLRTWLLILPLAFLLIRCESGRGAISATERPHSYLDKPIRTTLWSEHYHYREGETVHLRFTLQNLSDEEVVLENSEQPVVDILLVDQQVRWSEGAGSDRNLSRLVLGPRESYVIDWYLPPFPSRSNYPVRGIWESVNGEVRLGFCYGLANC